MNPSQLQETPVHQEERTIDRRILATANVYLNFCNKIRKEHASINKTLQYKKPRHIPNILKKRRPKVETSCSTTSEVETSCSTTAEVEKSCSTTAEVETSCSATAEVEASCTTTAAAENPSEAETKLYTCQNTILRHCCNGLTDVMIEIGPNRTKIPEDLFEKSLNWEKPEKANTVTSKALRMRSRKYVRHLIYHFFPLETLTTHSFTGRPSPHHVKDTTRKPKPQLDGKITEDILDFVSNASGLPDKTLKSAITSACADSRRLLLNKCRKNNK